jgi:hypothetical protein
MEVFMPIISKRVLNVFVTLSVFLTILLTGSLASAQSYSQSGGTVTDSNKTYTSGTNDLSGVLVTNSGVFNLSKSTITTSGNTSSEDKSSFEGLNAGVLANSNGKINLTNCTVNTTGTGANGIFAYGTGVITVKGGSVYCTGRLGHGIMCSGGGTITATDLDMTSTNSNSGVIATDRGGGTITVTGGTVKASGQDAPGIYSTGKITVTGSTISASGSEAAVIEGANSIVLNNVDLSTSKADKWGVLIYQSMSGDAEGTDGVFTMTGGKLSNTAATGPLFYNTNSTAIITLKGVNVTASSGTLLQAVANSRWGTTGKNGGHSQLTADGQTLSGNIIADSYSTFIGTLKNSSALTGAINNANTASSASLTMDASSSWTLTANSNLSTISDAAGISGTSVTNITGNGYNVYYNSALSANSPLGGKTYSLVNGGVLAPVGTSAVDESKDGLPLEWSLEQNYPNPFNPSTKIKFALPEAGNVALKIYDALGKEVATLASGALSAGYHSYVWNASAMSSGVYIYRLTVSSSKSGSKAYAATKKLLLMK